jgi:hypothetical protein
MPRNSGSFGLVALITVALGGCGLPLIGSGDGQDDAIRDAITAAFTTKDPSVCAKLLTEHWLETFYSSSTTTPMTQCREELPSHDPAVAVDVSAIRINGASATATATAIGDGRGLKRVKVTLLDEHGWKLDSLDDVQLDRSRFLAEMRNQTLDSSSGLLRRYEQCELHYVSKHVKTAELEAAVINRTSDYTVGAFHSCAREIRAVFSRVIIGNDDPFTKTQRRCIAAVADRGMSERELRRFYGVSARNGPAPAWVAPLRTRAIAHCTA